jgi:hypothetical protein
MLSAREALRKVAHATSGSRMDFAQVEFFRQFESTYGVLHKCPSTR